MTTAVEKAGTPPAPLGGEMGDGVSGFWPESRDAGKVCVQHKRGMGAKEGKKTSLGTALEAR